MQHADVVIVGTRCAGTAAASVLARAGRKAVVLDRTRFPSDTLSTHLLFPTGVQEIKRMGALPRIHALNPSLLPYIRLAMPGVDYMERFREVEPGIDYGMCVPRDLQDNAFVDTVRELGADVREGCDVQALLWSGGRVSAVRYRDADGEVQEIAARLVIGADGRRSTVAAHVGAWRPYRVSRNGRGLIFRYMDDPLAGTDEAEVMSQWRDGTSFGMAFPCTPKGRVLALFMPDAAEVALARKDPEGYWQRKLAEHPALAERLRGATNMTKLRSTGETPAFFRASSGPGWALVGDAGHFKDPVIAQGMRDAMWMGRTLAEAVLPVLEDPAAVDSATRRWERERDWECLPQYHWANSETRIVRPSPVLRAAARAMSESPDQAISDVFGRVRTPQQVITLPLLFRALGSALRRGEEPRRAIVREALGELKVDLRVRAEHRGNAFRRTRTVPGSEHPGWTWPKAPGLKASSAVPVPETVTA